MKRSKLFLKMIFTLFITLAFSYSLSYAQIGGDGPEGKNPPPKKPKLGPCEDKTAEVVVIEDDIVCVKADGTSTRMAERKVNRDSSGKVTSITYECPPGYDRKKVSDSDMACEVAKKMEGMPAECKGTCPDPEVCTDKTPKDKDGNLQLVTGENNDKKNGVCTVTMKRICKCEKPGSGGSAQ